MKEHPIIIVVTLALAVMSNLSTEFRMSVRTTYVSQKQGSEIDGFGAVRCFAGKFGRENR